jgi:hypothetical protein
MRRIAIGAALLCGLFLIGSATPALAQPTATTQVSVLDATKGACSGGMATWTVHLRVTINNGSTSDDTITDVKYTGKYNAGGTGQTATNDTRVIDSDGLEPGVTIAPGTSQTFEPTVQITIPCNATAATLFVTYNLVDGHKAFTGGAQFLANGTAVPPGAVGALGLVAIAGIAMLARRKHSVVTTQPSDRVALRSTEQ